MSSSLVSVHVAVSEPAHSVGSTLQSLAAQTYAPLQIVLIDNASQDREAPWPRFGGSEIMVLRNFRDQGFVRGHNQALSSLYARWSQDTWDHRYIMLLSSRVTLATNAVQELVRVLEEDSACMAVAPKVRRATRQVGEDMEDLQLVDTGVLEQAGLVFSSALEVVSRGRGDADTGQYDDSSSQVLSGTFCLLLRASALMRAKVGEEWLDADLPESYAMADLIWRLQTLRMQTRYVSQAVAWVQTGTAKPVGVVARIRRWYGQEALQERGMRSYACVLRVKNAPWSKIFLTLPRLKLVWFLRFWQALFDPRVLPLMVRSWMKLPSAFRKRRFLHPIRQAQGELAISQSRR